MSLFKNQSDLLRKEGNNIYESSKKMKNRVARISTLQKAIKCYQNAVNEATDFDQLSSGLKNIANAQFCLVREYTVGNETNLEVFYMKQSLENISRALRNGSNIKSKEWHDFLIRKAVESIEEYNRLIANNEFDQKIQKLNSLVKPSTDEIKFHVNFLICDTYRRGSISALETDFKKSVQRIKECYFHYQECVRLKKSVTNNVQTQSTYLSIDEEKLEELIEDVAVQESVAEAHQQKHIADQIYDESINSSESVEIELVWNAIDDYKAAVLKSHDKDIEVEAECMSKMATIFEKILDLKTLARNYHYKCLELAESMKPKTFNNCSWYLKSKAAVERYQKEVVSEEERIKEEKRKTVIDKIQPNIDEMRAKFDANNDKGFLEYIYEKYPPKKSEHKLDAELLKTSMKKAYRNALTHYHTDKNSEDKYGLEWYFTCEEISKFISNKFERLKGED